MVVGEAEHILALQELKIEVIDSTYSDKVPFGTIVEQDPTPESHVKQGRTIYVTVNASGKRQIIMPDLHDISYRQAETTLCGIGLVVDEEYDYEPSEYRDLVLDIKDEEGLSIEPGEKIAVGTKVRLVVGFGRGTEEVEVPSVIGMTYQEARSTLLNYRLTVGAVNYDEEESDTIQYVYRQTPQEGTIVIEGEPVTLRLSSDIEKAATDKGDEDEENWF
jgi:beta-lactam-binding protein with PASTA domain